jgi:hypothetical protein
VYQVAELEVRVGALDIVPDVFSYMGNLKIAMQLQIVQYQGSLAVTWKVIGSNIANSISLTSEPKFWVFGHAQCLVQHYLFLLLYIEIRSLVITQCILISLMALSNVW